MIQMSALPGLLLVIAGAGNGLNCWVKDRHKHEPKVQKSHEEVFGVQLKCDGTWWCTGGEVANGVGS